LASVKAADGIGAGAAWTRRDATFRGAVLLLLAAPDAAALFFFFISILVEAR
jgi:hypothetical protein